MISDKPFVKLMVFPSQKKFFSSPLCMIYSTQHQTQTIWISQQGFKNKTLSWYFMNGVQAEEAREKLRPEKEVEAEGLEKERVNLIDLFKTPNLRVNAILVNIIW